MIPADRYESLQALLRDALVQFKTETALIEANRKREVARYTYLEFKREAEALARRLQDFGVEAGTRVAICMSNQPAYLMSAYAAFFRGAVVVPVDYKLTAKEQQALYAHCRPHVLITEYGIHRQYKGLEVPHVLVTEAPASATLAGAERWEDTKRDAPAPDFVARRREDQATLVYSSGTGGKPKGCMLSHGNYLEQYKSLSKVFPLELGDRYLSILPTNHAIDFMSGFIGPLCGGATVVHQRTLRPEFINDSLERFSITHMSIVPMILEAFERRIDEKLDERSELAQALVDGLTTLNAALTLRKPNRALSTRLLRPIHKAFGGHLRYLFCGGAFVDPRRARRFYDLGIPVVIGYGLTEAGTVLTVNDLKPFRADSVGRPLEGVTIEIRDADASGSGEVWVKTPTIMMGYLDDPEQTAEALVDGWLRTGDVGFLDASGQLHLVGRRKNMIVTSGGKNVYPEDIESVFDEVDCEELAVFAESFLFPGVTLTDDRLVVVIRGKDHAAITREIDGHNRRLADYKRVGGLLFIPEDFPRTASMKIKRAPLAELVRGLASRTDVRSIGGA